MFRRFTSHPRDFCSSLSHTSAHESCRNKQDLIHLTTTEVAFMCLKLLREARTLEGSPIACGGARKTGCVTCIFRSCGCASVCVGLLDRSRRSERTCLENGVPSLSSDLVLYKQRLVQTNETTDALQHDFLYLPLYIVTRTTLFLLPSIYTNHHI